MDSPNSTENSSTGMDVSIVPVGVNPRTPAKWSSWNTYTIAPYDAVSDRRFSTRAVSGMTTLPVNRNSTTKVISTMMAAAAGRCPDSDALVSTSWAEAPVTIPPRGEGSSRMLATSCSPAGEYGCTEGTTDNQVPSAPAKRLASG